MTTPAPYQKPTGTPAGPTAAAPTDRSEVTKLALAVEDALIESMKTSYRDTRPTPAIGTAPPVAQPGRTPMTQRATDASALMVAGGFLSLCLGAAVSAVLHFSGGANETVVVCLCAAPPATLFTLGRLLRRAKEVVEAAPADQHHHYSGTVYQDQRQIRSQTSGVWVTNRNELPPGTQETR